MLFHVVSFMPCLVAILEQSPRWFNANGVKNMSFRDDNEELVLSKSLCAPRAWDPWRGRMPETPRWIVAGLEKSPLLARFEDFELDLRAGELRQNGSSAVRLSEQPFRILKTLLEHTGEVVLREEIRKALWPNGTIVEFEHSINAAMKRLRQALGDSAENPHYIETLSRRGYRWMVPVEWVDDATRRPRSPGVAPPEPESSASNLIGKKVSHYRVLEVLGGGGMGLVYRAEDIKLGRRVALKFLPEESAKDPAALRRFEHEARAASALNHPNICTIHAVEEHEGQPFIAMELLEGQTLRELISSSEQPSLERHSLPLDTLLRIAIQIADGLEAAHKKGIVHRDIKPANIFVTTQGPIKILDFGLAKLQESEAPDLQTPALAEQESKPDWNHNLTLTRTGTPFGTAGYMSPEQVRGEKLDARTDLFSFGLVLYEMAAGQRAFAGETASILLDAILDHAPTPVRELNPEMPPELEEIVNRALEKDRELRYQSAVDICTDLQRLRRENQTPLEATVETTTASQSKVGAITRWFKWLALAVFVLLAAAISRQWLGLYRAQSNPLEDQKQRRLTANSTENPVTNGAISPDGKQLAYADVRGIHIEQIESGQVRDLAAPESLKGTAQSWQIVNNWIRDASAIIANATPPAQQPSIWLVPLTGEPMRKTRDDALAWTLSRDGKWVAFGANLSKLYYRELWIMRPDGSDARKVLDADRDSGFGGAEWSPDGQRLAYVKVRQTSESGEVTVESRSLDGGPPTMTLNSADAWSLEDWSWSPDGRIIYSLREDKLMSCNFWQLRLDTRTGEAVEKPRRLTNWSGFCLDNPSFSANGKQLAFLRSALQSGVYLADLRAGGTQVSTPALLTLNEGRNNPVGWTADSKAVVFLSNRDGYPRFFHQVLGDGTAEPIGSALPSLFVDPHMSPDGDWILYLIDPDSYPNGFGSSQPVYVMRMGIGGGEPQLVMRTSVGSKPSLRCARLPAKLCAIAERSSDQEQIIFTRFDPLQGRESEIARFGIKTTLDADYAWDLSPDGTRIAILKRSEGTISLLSLVGEAPRNIVVKAWSKLQTVDWSADGKELFASCLTNGGSTLLRVDLEGNAYALWETKGSSQPPGDLFYSGTLAPRAVPSPDGRHLAIQSWSLSANMWMIENF
jgi:eukaryotic-like serine/threonine-protein kinase